MDVCCLQQVRLPVVLAAAKGLRLPAVEADQLASKGCDAVSLAVLTACTINTHLHCHAAPPETDHPPFLNEQHALAATRSQTFFEELKEFFSTPSTSRRRRQKFKLKNWTVRKQLHPSLFLFSTSLQRNTASVSQISAVLSLRTRTHLNNHQSVQRQQRCSEPTILPAAASLQARHNLPPLSCDVPL